MDYIISNEKAVENIKRMDEGDRTKLDHVPIEVELEEQDRQIMKQKEKQKVIEKSYWNEEGIKN